MAAVKLPAKQIDKSLSAFVPLTAIAVPTTVSSINVTAALTAALGALGVPVQVANSVPADPQGVVTTAGFNLDPIWLSASKAKLLTAAGDSVFGRVSQAAGVYTVNFFTLTVGVETPYSTTAATSFDILVQYLFSFANYPSDGALRVPELYPDSSQSSSGGLREVLAVTAVNTIANTAGVPNGTKPITLLVNGQALDNLGGTPPFSVAGQAVTWSAANAGFALATTDRVVISYFL